MLTHQELEIITEINRRNLDSGRVTVTKRNGRLIIDGKQNRYHPPVIKLPHWVEGTKAGIVIEAQR